VKYDLPAFLNGVVSREKYRNWIDAKAASLRRRDKKHTPMPPPKSLYKEAVHKAVCDSEGKDAYTGERLDWSLIGKYENEKSKQGRRGYWKEMRLLPTIDHTTCIPGDLEFEICGLQTNDSKSWLSHEELVEFCKMVVRHSDNYKANVASRL
jgi:hypothetical protein